jgi:HPr kinase/phosphorylase
LRFHGVLVEVDGMGVLLAGPSGAGKSLCALELVVRGHRLVADDAVELTREGERLVGRAAQAVGPHLEIRGLGILSVPELYGPAAVAERASVELLCRLVPEGAGLDLTGLDEEREELLGVALPRVALPSGLGASLASVVDAAVREQRRRQRGEGSAHRFDARLQRLTGAS